MCNHMLMISTTRVRLFNLSFRCHYLDIILYFVDFAATGLGWILWHNDMDNLPLNTTIMNAKMRLDISQRYRSVFV